MGVDREMTLGEYVDRLPESHGARLEYTRLVRYLRHNAVHRAALTEEGKE